MPNTYYDSELAGAQIESALEAIHGVVSQENNGKVLAIENGKIVAKSASEWTDTPVLEPLNVIANGDYTPGTGVDGYNAVHVAVPGAGTIAPLSVTQNGTYNPPSGVDGYAPVTVNVQGGGSKNILHGEDYPDDSLGNDGDIYLRSYYEGTDISRVAWIGLGGSSYFDTGYNPTPNTSVEITFFADNVAPGDGAFIFGSRGSPVQSSRNAGGIECMISTSGPVMPYISSGLTTYQIPTNNYLNWVKIRLSPDKAQVIVPGDDSKGAEISISPRTETATAPLLIFAITNYETSTRPTGRLYQCKIKEGDTVVRNYVAALDGNDTPCLCDLVSKSYLMPIGSAATAGSAIDGCDESYVKVNGEWRMLYGTDIDDIDLGDSGYTFENIDYYEFNGNNSVVVLPVLLTDDIQTETDFMVTGTADDQVVSGAWDITQSGNITWTRIICENSSIYIGNGTFTGQVSKVAQWQNVRHVVKTNVDGQVWLDEEAIGAYVSYQPPRDIPLSVGGSHMTTVQNPFVGRIYGYKVSSVSSGDTLCDLKPVKLSIPSLNITTNALYDTITGGFFVP